MNANQPDRTSANWPEALRRAFALTQPDRSPARFWASGNTEIPSDSGNPPQGVISTTV